MSKAKKRMYTEKYYSLTEPEMQAIIKLAQTGDGVAQLQLLEIFSNFLSKYTTMLYYGKFSFGDYDVRRFISLFVKDASVRRYLSRNKLNQEGAKHVHEVMRGIRYMIQRYGDEEDVDQTVQLTFLQCVERYAQRGEVPFSGYLYSYYFYLLKKNVEMMLIDQLGRKTFPLINDSDSEDWDSDEHTVGFRAPPTPAVDELLHAESIDEMWVAGDTARSPFDVLTVQERQLIKWRYVNGDRSSDIANKVTEHPNTVREHFNRIRQKLRQQIELDIRST